MSHTLVQLVAAAAPGDAVTGQAIAWKRVLDRAGVHNHIHAQHIHPDMADVVRPLATAPRDGSPILLRYSIWSDTAAWALHADAPLGVIYHNITPAHLVRPLDPALADLCALGRTMLPAFRAKVTSVVADSAYNAAELRRAGWPKATVIPLLLPLPVPPPARDEVPATMLFVGRVAPSKRVEDLVEVLAYVRAHHLPHATLQVVGAPGPDAYMQLIRQRIVDRGLGDAVHLRGRVSDHDRDAAYQQAGVYVSMSAHEGFCAPLLEAMSRGLPVVARAAGAVPETTGRAALLVPGPDIPLAGEAVVAALTRPRVRHGLRTNARAQLADLQRRASEDRILDSVAPLLAQ